MVKGRVSFANGTKGGRTLRKKERRPGAFGQNCPAFFLLALGSRGGVPRAPAALGRRPWSSAAASGRGKRSRAALGTDSQPQFGQGRSRVTWPRRPSANGRRRPRAGVPEARWRAIGRGGVPVGLSGAQTHLDSGRGVVERGLRGGQRRQRRAAALEVAVGRWGSEEAVRRWRWSSGKALRGLL